METVISTTDLALSVLLTQKHNMLYQYVMRAVPLAFLWWVLTTGEVSSWLIGIPVIAAATFVSLQLLPASHRSWRVIGLCRFAPAFLWLSVRGSIDVALRALHPQLPLTPCFLHYPLRLSDAIARVFFVNTISLLPGTLSADIVTDGVTVHSLDDHGDVHQQLAALESLVAEIFDETLSPSLVPVEHRDE
jgi:multicomponent Na+:H+ antiporter subunit E